MANANQTKTLKAWRTKAERLIAEACRASYLQVNTKRNGTKYKKHRPYAVPLFAANLVECLDTNDEHRAKSLFMSVLYSPEMLTE